MFTQANITMKLEKFSNQIEGTNVTKTKNQSLTTSNATTSANVTSNVTVEQK
jgi:hypothetical protein